MTSLFPARATATLIAALTMATAAQADSHTPYVFDPTKGYLDCNIPTAETIQVDSLETAMQMAYDRGAPGFLFNINYAFVDFLLDPYPADCDSVPVSDWPIYLAAQEIQFYTRASHGIAGCDVDLGDMLTNRDLNGMFEAARFRDAAGFTFDPKTNSGQVFATPVPDSCTPAPDPDLLVFKQRR